MTNDELTKRLHELRTATGAALADAHKSSLRGALAATVNWADLHCVDASFVVSLAEGKYYRVDIEEAAPDNEAFKIFIERWLDAAGFGLVVVYTEW